MAIHRHGPGPPRMQRGDMSPEAPDRPDGPFAGLPDRARFDYAFTCIDRDGDGRVSRADLDRLGTTPDPTLRAKVTRALDSFWELLSLCVDATDHVDREGFVLFQRLAGEDVVTFVG